MVALDRGAQFFVAVVVVADLLDHLPGLEAKLLGPAALTFRVVRGRAHEDPP